MQHHWGPFTEQPNILILMTDQQRTTQHYPTGWEERNLPNLTSLKASGVTFPNAMTNTTACSPSRGVLFTGTYPTVNGITAVGNSVLKVGETVTLPDQPARPIATLGLMMQDKDLMPDGVSYDIAYKGKWHLDKDYQNAIAPADQKADATNLGADDQDMEERYGFPGWTSPDFGTAMDLSKVDKSTFDDFYTLGAGLGQNDARVTKGISYSTEDDHTVTVENAVGFLRRYRRNSEGTNPFMLVVSLLNPHDIWVYPDSLKGSGFEKDRDGCYPWDKAPFTDISLPDTYKLSNEQLANKPSAQNETSWRTDFNEATATEYVRFYAYLETLTDALLGEVMEAFHTNPGNDPDNTLVIRLADHGEMAMAQGGMREKEHQVYNETLLVPMIFSNPNLPQGKTCEGLSGLIDVLPTIMEVVGVTPDALTKAYAVQGVSLCEPILRAGHGKGETYPQLLFATDDSEAHIRTLIDADTLNAKYSVYYTMDTIEGNPNGTASEFQYEMYNFSYNGTTECWDDEATNRVPVCGQSPVSIPVLEKWANMHEALTQKLVEYDQMPENWPTTIPQPLSR